jgi:hypothetical protein
MAKTKKRAPKTAKRRKPTWNDPLVKRAQTKRKATPATARARTTSTVQHILTVNPATSFQYRFESSTGARRIIHLERGAVEPPGASTVPVASFRAGVYPGGPAPTQGGFYTSPDSVNLIAQAILHIEGIVAGDSLICRSLGSWNGLKVTVELFREYSDGSIGRILHEEIQDADAHTYTLP